MNFSDVFEVQRLLTDFTWFADRGDGNGLAALFLPEAVFTVGNLELRGREAIAADCYRRWAAGPRKTRHLWCNFRLERVLQGEISTTVVQMTFEQTTPGQATQLRVNDVFDSFRRDDSTSWRFAHRIIKREMALAIPSAEV
jgi:hypothetical protein